MRILLRILIAKIFNNLYDKTIDFSKQNRNKSNKAISISQTYVVLNFSNLRVFINRRVLIDCRFWNKRTKICENDELNWQCNKLILILVFQLFMRFAFVSLYVINSFLDVVCWDVNNRKNACTFEIIEANSLIVVANSLRLL